MIASRLFRFQAINKFSTSNSSFVAAALTRFPVSSAMARNTLATRTALAISSEQDDGDIRVRYRPFLLDAETEVSDWISELELEVVADLAEQNLARTKSRLKVLVLYGSLRKR
jgi:arsenic resistance protein ArsH